MRGEGTLASPASFITRFVGIREKAGDASVPSPHPPNPRPYGSRTQFYGPHSTFICVSLVQLTRCIRWRRKLDTSLFYQLFSVMEHYFVLEEWL